MNLKEIGARQRQHLAKGIGLNKRVEVAKRDGTLKSVDADIKRWLAEDEHIKADKNKAVQAAMKGYGFTGSETGAKVVNPAASPLTIPESEYRGLWEAAIKRLPSYQINTRHLSDVTTKAPFAESGFTSGSLPPTLLPQLSLDLPYEPDDAFAHFKQMMAPESRAVEYIQHTGNTNPASAVAELGVKSDLGMQLTTVSTPYVKLAALASVSMEALQDFSAFMSWVPHELQRAVVDCRTNEFVNGSGTAPHMLGILNTSGVLTRWVGSDTPIDAIRKAINDIRVGSSYAEASLILTNPTTFADLTLQRAPRDSTC